MRPASSCHFDLLRSSRDFPRPCDRRRRHCVCNSIFFESLDFQPGDAKTLPGADGARGKAPFFFVPETDSLPYLHQCLRGGNDTSHFLPSDCFLRLLPIGVFFPNRCGWQQCSCLATPCGRRPTCPPHPRRHTVALLCLGEGSGPAWKPGAEHMARVSASISPPSVLVAITTPGVSQHQHKLP